MILKRGGGNQCEILKIARYSIFIDFKYHARLSEFFYCKIFISENKNLREREKASLTKDIKKDLI